MAEAKKLDEKQKTGVSYIYTFYNNVVTLTNYYAQYLNLLLEYKMKFSTADLQKLEEGEQKIVTGAVQICRQTVISVFIQYQSITKALKIDDSEKDKVREQYDKIKETFIIDTQDLEDFVCLMNEVLVNNVIKNLLESNQDIISDLFDHGNTTTGNTTGK